MGKLFTKIIRGITLEQVSAFCFLIFFVLTPLTIKIKLREGIYQEGIYVEPLLPFLGLSLFLFLWSLWKRSRRRFWLSLKEFLFPVAVAKIFYLLIFVLFLAWIYGVLLTGNPAFGDLLRLLKYALYFSAFPLAFASVKILGEKESLKVFLLVFLVGVVISALSLLRIYQFSALGGEIDFWAYSPASRSVGFLGQFLDLKTFQVGQIAKAAHGTFGLYLSVVLGVGLALLSQMKEFSKRWVLGLLGIGVVFAALLYTLSRGAVMTGILVILGGLVWLLKEKKRAVLGVLLAFFLLESVVLVQINPEVYQKFASTFPAGGPVAEKIGEFSSSLRSVLLRFRGISALPPSSPTASAPVKAPALDQSLGDRVVMWRETIKLLHSRPLFTVLGVGYSTENVRFFTEGAVVYPHSLFLDFWVRGGLLALALGILIWILLFLKTATLWFSKAEYTRALGFVLFSFLAGWLLDNFLSGEQFFSDAPMLAFWGVLGLVTALAQVESKKSKVKVLITLTSSEVGGAPKVVYDLLLATSHKPSRGAGVAIKDRVQATRQFDFVVALPKGGPFVKKFRDLGYTVYTVPFDKVGPRGFMQLFKIVRKEEIDLINSHGKGAGLYARLVGAVLSIRVVHTFHGIHYFRYGKVTRWVYFNFERLMSQLTRLVINVSASQQREGIALKLFPREKARVVENGMSTRPIGALKSERLKIRRRLGIDEKDFMAVVLARFDPIKGHARLVEILPMVLVKVPRLKVVFVGDGEEENKVKKLVKELGVSGSVVFAGRQDAPFPILSSADVLLHPSYHEGLPLSPLEASALAVPVVAAQAVGNVDTVLSGKTGYLVDFREAAEVAEVLRRLSQSAALRRRMGEQGRRWVAERFPMEKFVGDTLAVYQESLKN